MPIRECFYIAIEGSHGCGKSVLSHALTAELKRRHLHVGLSPEVARDSPFVEDAVLHKTRKFDYVAELHLLSAQITAELGLARLHQIAICDKSLINILAYWRALDVRSPESAPELYDSVLQLVKNYVRQYDVIFHLSDRYDLSRTQDPLRPHDLSYQNDAASALHDLYTELEIKPRFIPQRLSLDDQVGWVLSNLEGAF